MSRPPSTRVAVGISGSEPDQASADPNARHSAGLQGVGLQGEPMRRDVYR